MSPSSFDEQQSEEELNRADPQRVETARVSVTMST